MVYQVGSPAMFEGNRFLPETGTPIWKMLRRRTVLELCEPDPFTVATWMLMLLTTRLGSARPEASRSATSVVAITIPFLLKWASPSPPEFTLVRVGKLFIIRQ